MNLNFPERFQEANFRFAWVSSWWCWWWWLHTRKGRIAFVSLSLVIHRSSDGKEAQFLCAIHQRCVSFVYLSKAMPWLRKVGFLYVYLEHERQHRGMKRRKSEIVDNMVNHKTASLWKFLWESFWLSWSKSDFSEYWRFYWLCTISWKINIFNWSLKRFAWELFFCDIWIYLN